MTPCKHPEWVIVPKRYRVTRVDWNRYDLESTLPLAIELSKLKNLGPGLRIESKGWGTGAYRVFRISTEALGGPDNFEPELVHVPAGDCWMGEPDNSDQPYHDAQPARRGYLDEFWIGRYPVTVRQFASFVEHHGYTTTVEEYYRRERDTWRSPREASINAPDRTRHPVVFVSLQDAKAYCHWLTEVTGKAYGLPTRQQWEKAAYGTDLHRYPWGDDEPDRTLCNIEHCFGGTTPVGQFSPAGDGPKFDYAYGCADMFGNVSEWTLDEYTHTSAVHPDCDPDFYYYKTKTYSVVCGPSWRMMRQSRSNHQSYNHASDDIGFRVVVRPSKNSESGSAQQS